MERTQVPRTLLQLAREDVTREEYKRRLSALRVPLTEWAGDDAILPLARATVLRGAVARLRGRGGLPAREAVDPAADLRDLLAELDRPGRGRPAKGQVVTTRLPAEVIAWMDAEVLRRGIPLLAEDTGRPELLRQLLAETMAREGRAGDPGE